MTRDTMLPDTGRDDLLDELTERLGPERGPHND